MRKRCRRFGRWLGIIGTIMTGYARQIGEPGVFGHGVLIDIWLTISLNFSDSDKG
jgi:hypothetical protein